MTSVDRDSSTDEGEPIYLYMFARQGNTWRYASSDRIESHAGDDYLPLQITNSGIRSGGDDASIEVSLPRDTAVALNWFPWPPSDFVYCTIFIKHVGETDALVVWSGRLVQPKFGNTSLTLVSEPTMSLVSGTAPSPRLQRSCWKTCFGPDCRADPEVHKVESTVTAIDGFTLTIPGATSFPDGRLVNGVVEWVRPDGIGISRTIEAHVGDQVTINYSDLSLVEDIDVVLLPGCKQSLDDCDEYFDNLVNCGAIDTIPIRNPHDGNPVR